MMTREEILAIDQYCQEHKISYRQRLEELSFSIWNFYKSKRKYRLEDEASASVGEGRFVQLQSGTFQSGAMPVRSNKVKKPASKSDITAECYMTVEVRTPNGTAMRIQGQMTASHLRELITAGNV